MPSGASGEPLWPAGVVGSITHCAGYRACCVARADAVAAVGIDAEPDRPLPPGVLDAVAGRAERDMTRALAADLPGVSWDRLLFSAKEAVYKAWFPRTGRRIGFEDAIVRIDPDPARSAFACELLVAPRPGQAAPTRFAGSWLAADGLLATAVIVPAPAPASAPRDGDR